MSSIDVELPSEWERRKFAIEAELKEKEIQISQNKLTLDNRRNIIIGVLVPITIAIMTALPTYLNSQNQLAIQKATFESELITQSVRTGDPDQAAVNLAFLVDVGLLSGTTADRITEYLKKRQPGTGRALPAE